MRISLIVAVIAAAALLSPETVLAAAAGGETHCVVDVVGERASGELIVSEPRCYSAFADAMADASHGSLALPSSARASVVFDDAMVAAAVSSFTLGIHYDGFNGTGDSISVAGTSCSGGWWNTGTVWGNRISSSYNGCSRLRHYDSPNKAGAYEDTYGAGTRDNLSALNNRTESVSYN